MYCKNCGKLISDTATFCDHCGQPTNENTYKTTSVQDKLAEENRKKNIVGLFLAIFASLLIIAVIIIATDGLGEKVSTSQPYQSSPISSSNADTPANTYGNGTYKVGVDIEEGEYYIYCTNYISCYVEVSSDSSGKLESIVTNDNVLTFAFVTVKSGQYLKINGGQFIKASNATVPGMDSNGNYGGGMYRVGIDIPAGEYKVTCTNGISCYIEVSSDSSGSLFSIISNDNIDTFSYITVAEGQYLTVNGGQFTSAN